MGNCIDLHGHRFGKLLVSEKDTSNVDSTYTMWKCICDCGKIISASQPLKIGLL